MVQVRVSMRVFTGCYETYAHIVQRMKPNVTALPDAQFVSNIIHRIFLSMWIRIEREDICTQQCNKNCCEYEMLPTFQEDYTSIATTIL